MLKILDNMAERKNFLIMAMGFGALGIIIGGYTIWNAASELFSP